MVRWIRIHCARLLALFSIAIVFQSTCINIILLNFVGLSNILDGELVGREPVERSHGEVVGAAVMDSELLGKVVE